MIGCEDWWLQQTRYSAKVLCWGWSHGAGFTLAELWSSFFGFVCGANWVVPCCSLGPATRYVGSRASLEGLWWRSRSASASVPNQGHLVGATKWSLVGSLPMLQLEIPGRGYAGNQGRLPLSKMYRHTKASCCFWGFCRLFRDLGMSTVWVGWLLVKNSCWMRFGPMPSWCGRVLESPEWGMLARLMEHSGLVLLSCCRLGGRGLNKETKVPASSYAWERTAPPSLTLKPVNSISLFVSMVFSKLLFLH